MIENRSITENFHSAKLVQKFPIFSKSFVLGKKRKHLALDRKSQPTSINCAPKAHVNDSEFLLTTTTNS